MAQPKRSAKHRTQSPDLSQWVRDRSKGGTLSLGIGVPLTTRGGLPAQVVGAEALSDPVMELVRQVAADTAAACAEHFAAAILGVPAAADRYDTPGAADYLNLSPATLEGWRSRGVGPAYEKLGSRVSYSKFSLDQYRADHTRHPANSSER